MSEKYDVIYYLHDDKESLGEIVKNNGVQIQDHLLNAIDFRKECDNRAEKYVNDIYRHLFPKDPQIFVRFGGDYFVESYFKKRILIDIIDILYPLTLVEKLGASEGFSDTVDVFPRPFNPVIYRYLKDKKVLNPIRIGWLSQLANYSLMLAKSFYFQFKMALFPEQCLIRSRRTRKPFCFPGRKASIGLQLSAGNGLRARTLKADFFVDGQSIKTKDVVCVVEEPWAGMEKDLSGEPYERIIFGLGMLKGYGLLNFIIRHYKRLVLYRFELARVFIQHCFYSNLYFRFMKNTLYWSIFYEYYKPRAFIRSMIHGSNISSVFHRKFQVENIFVFTSVIEEIIPEKYMGFTIDSHEYAYMDFDRLVSDRQTNMWLGSFPNQIRRFDNIGPLISEWIVKGSLAKDDILERAGIPQNKKIIGFFDHKIGIKSVWTSRELSQFIYGMIEVCEKFEVSVLYRSKRPLDTFISKLAPEVKNLLMKHIDQGKLYYIGPEVDVSSFELMSICDLVVSAPKSTVVYLCLYAGKKVVVFDPSRDYTSGRNFTNGLGKMTCYDLKGMLDLVEYWIGQGNDKLHSANVEAVRSHFSDNYSAYPLSRFSTELSAYVLGRS
jgi:hypothetical protein